MSCLHIKSNTIPDSILKLGLTHFLG